MAKSRGVLPLPFSPPSEVPPPTSQAEAAIPQPLWLALAFPKLALEVHVDRRRDSPAVAVRAHKGRSVVHTVSRTAEIRGVSAGMAVNAAFALCPGLDVYPYDEQSQLDRLQQLAAWAEQYTSRVSLQPPHALLLEVGGSMKLFGGLSAIRKLVRQQLTQRWQLSFYSAVTPAPMASLLLAYSGRDEVVRNKQQLRSVLGSLPVKGLPIELKKKQQLHSTGVRILRDLWRLPREDLARRFGPELIHYLDRTLGLAPDPLEFFVSPDEFEACYEFSMDVHDSDLLFNAAGQLLQQLAGFLRQRDACINQCQFQLYHDRQHVTRVTVGVRRATRDHRHLATLLRERLDRLLLEAPVRRIRLTASELMPFRPQELSLFLEPALDQNPACSESDIETLLEQLQARMGRDAVRTFHGVADHRPEYAYVVNGAAAGKSERVMQQRPFWLLPEPRLLPQKDRRPWLQGPVVLVRGPERIQAGWWSGRDVGRDYYIAVDSKGSRLWIFRELDEHCRWYLHGLFA